ncbi:MAG TPA: winged helix-turn-helix domain-containing protein, partial [Steroidobacteraceae bacterium]|nr:winged helix-turn-helix domain-containing protein [Steroidobacteraceae bacterium]
MNLIRVDDLLVDLGRCRVLRAGVDLKLPGLSFDLFVVLVRSAPNVVTVRALMDTVWPDAVVSPETISQRVKLLRAALGDDVKSPRYVGGVRNRGYRIVATVTPVSPETLSSPDAASSPHPSPHPSPPSWSPRPAPEPAVTATRTAIATSGFHGMWRLAAPLALVIAAVVALDGSASRQAGRIEEIVESGPPPGLATRAVAVLPFESLGRNAQEDQNLAAGLGDSVRQVLADNPKIAVAARGPSVARIDQASDFREIGHRLNARFLLEGSLQPVGLQTRVRAALIDATSGQTIWSLNFDRPSADLPAAREEIAARLGQILGATVNASADEWRKTATTSNPEAYFEYLQARALADSYRLADLRQAVSHYARALEIDPAFSGALSGLAWARYEQLEF